MDFNAAVAELDALVRTLEREGDERALLLLELVDAIHRPGLERIAAGESDHQLARALLAMYDLAPVDDRVLAEEALEEVRPYLRSHGGEVALVEVREGVVEIELTAGTAKGLRDAIEQALREHFAGFRELVTREPPAPLVAIAHLRGSPAAGPLRAVDADGVSVLLVDVEGELHGFRNTCPVDGLPLEGGRLADSVLVCPWHNCAFDARTGERVDDAGGPGLVAVDVR